jgi:hypothetical protein
MPYHINWVPYSMAWRFFWLRKNLLHMASNCTYIEQESQAAKKE